MSTNAFIVYDKCGKCLTAFSTDLYGELEPLDEEDREREDMLCEDGKMLMRALRAGRRVAYVSVDEARAIPFGCQCGTQGKSSESPK